MNAAKPVLGANRSSDVLEMVNRLDTLTDIALLARSLRTARTFKLPTASGAITAGRLLAAGRPRNHCWGFTSRNCPLVVGHKQVHRLTPKPPVTSGGF